MPNGCVIQTDPTCRPDIVNRVFNAKMKALIDDIENGQIFGKVAAYVKVVEFQKRGLPHMHMLIILDEKDKLKTPEDVDNFISAEIPWHDPELFAIVDRWMAHDPCGYLNPDAKCMKNGKCRFNYPKE